jgi:glycosyltransferase involved in cell wall biosynthesis
MRIALAHDWLCGRRGGEAVLERIAAIVLARYDPAGLFVMFDDGCSIGPAVDALRDARQVSVSDLGRFPGAVRLRRWLLPCYPSAIEQLSEAVARAHARRPINLLISSSSAAVKGLRPPPGVPHLCYCHSPARYLWSRREEYAGGLRGVGLRVFGQRLREWDRRTAGNVTRFVANSTHVRGEVRSCYGQEAAVVFPPVRTGYFTPDPGTRREDFWLVVSALEPYKRVDLALAAATRANKRLLVAGDGSQRRALARAAGPTVSLVGRTSDEELRRLYRTAGVLLFPQVEDFGIVAVEAQACGLPVAARRAGGALDTVVEGRTGVFFDEPTPEAIVSAADCIPQDPGACRENALRFSETTFDRAITAQIEAAACPGQPGSQH